MPLDFIAPLFTYDPSKTEINLKHNFPLLPPWVICKWRQWVLTGTTCVPEVMSILIICNRLSAGVVQLWSYTCQPALDTVDTVDTGQREASMYSILAHHHILDARSQGLFSNFRLDLEVVVFKKNIHWWFTGFEPMTLGTEVLRFTGGQLEG